MNLLDEHKAAVAKIDTAVQKAFDRAKDALKCAKGCSSCCVDGLTVLPVEAALIEASGRFPPAKSMPGMCAFLDESGACSIYEVRPVMCRTHGLALKTTEAQGPPRPGAGLGRLRVLADDVSACELNYTTRAPKPDEVLDANKLMALLVTVDRRFRAPAGILDDASRVSLRDLAAKLRAR